MALATFFVVGLCVLLHYEGLNRLALRHHDARGQRGRKRVITVIFSALLLHISEIVLFGLAWWTILHWPASGSVTGMATVRLHDALYLSSMAFSSLGFDGAAPVGAIRLLAGIEALTGLVLITWSASFTYLEMERHWKTE